VKITVCRHGEKKVMHGRLDLDQDDLTSTLMPVRLEHEPLDYDEFTLTAVS
jgi:hypothetical protein